MNERDADQKSTQLSIGLHTLTFEPPDTVLLVGAGAIDGAAASAMIEQIVDWSRDRPYMLFVFDVVRVSALSADARKVFTSNGHRLPLRVLSLFGGPFKVRVVLDLMDRASTLLGSKNRFVKHWPDETSARAWIAEMRPVLAAKAGARTKTR